MTPNFLLPAPLQDLWLWLIEPLSFLFMRQAIAIGFLLGILSAVVGSYLILQEMGMMSGVISHAVLPGILIAFFLEINSLMEGISLYSLTLLPGQLAVICATVAISYMMRKLMFS